MMKIRTQFMKHILNVIFCKVGFRKICPELRLTKKCAKIKIRMTSMKINQGNPIVTLYFRGQDLIRKRITPQKQKIYPRMHKSKNFKTNLYNYKDSINKNKCLSLNRAIKGGCLKANKDPRAQMTKFHLKINKRR